MTPSSPVARYSRISYLLNLHRIKGWPYVASWAHRISGVLLAVYVLLHIQTLSGLHDPAQFARKMEAFAAIFPSFFDWLLAIPVIYHAVNGGRLLLYEVFGNRRDRIMLQWVLLLCGTYLLLLGVQMIIGNQGVSPLFFWIYLTTASGLLTAVTVSRLRLSGAALGWKLQRISGAFLLLMIPAHMLFMHLDPAIGRDAELIIARLGNPLIKIIDLVLVVAVMFHGAYGLRGICLDYLSSPRSKTVATAVVVLVSLLFTWRGIALIVSI